MNLDMQANIQQVIEVTDKETNEVTYMVYHDNEWKSISRKEYQKIIKGEE